MNLLTPYPLHLIIYTIGAQNDKPLITLAESPIGREPTPAGLQRLAVPLAKAKMKEEIEDCVRWGNTDVRKIIARFYDPDDPILTKAFIAECIEETFREMAEALRNQHPGQAVLSFLYQLDTINSELADALKHAHKPGEIATLSNALIKAGEKKIKFLQQFGVLDAKKVLADFEEVTAQGRLIEKDEELMQLAADAENHDVYDDQWVAPEE